MKKIELNHFWRFRKNGDTEFIDLDLPHDAMIFEKRHKDNSGGKNISWFSGGNYEYIKNHFFDLTLENSIIYLEFEGVYKNAEIYINDVLIYARPYGYTNFFVNISKYINFDNENTIRVVAKNNDQPNSRWYSGSGIFRPVNLYILPKEHIVLNSIKIKTIDTETKTINVKLQTTGKGLISIDILDDSKNIKSLSFDQDGEVDLNVDIPNAMLWDINTPKLYVLKVKYCSDEHTFRFGIRDISVSSKTGFLLNGERVILKGACIHHDNGLIGSVGHPYADKRKARILKEQGYNAIRSAHNPISSAFLEECDEIGLLVVDEYIDMWYIHKTKYDYADDFMDWWKQDLKDMIEKDYNHPSVIMYSIGNEVAETSEKKGIDLTKQMTKYIHTLDDRPVTCGINVFFNYLYSLGFGVYSDKKAEVSMRNPSKRKVVGSEFFNELAGKLGATTMKIGAWLPGSDKHSKQAFSHLDVAGYNYGILRYKKDLKKYPDRVILGTETFCKDAKKFYDMAQKYQAIIGDFVWTGMDYLGEAGCGSWVSQDITTDFSGGLGWMSAGSGRIDLLGNPLSEMSYMRVAYDIDTIRMGVIPVNEYKKKHSPSAWKMTNAIESWTWEGYEGHKTIVEVYTKETYVELKLNGTTLGKKKPNKMGVAKFKVSYVPGIIEAIGMNKDGYQTCKTYLETGTSETVLTLQPEQTTLGVNDLIYVHVRITDPKGILKPLQHSDIHLTVENGKILGFGNGCPYNETSYVTDTCGTYLGEALAIIRPLEKRQVSIHVISDYGDENIDINIQ